MGSPYKRPKINGFAWGYNHTCKSYNPIHNPYKWSHFTLQQTNIAMENGPFEDVFPIKNMSMWIFHCCVGLPEGILVVTVSYSENV